MRKGIASIILLALVAGIGIITLEGIIVTNFVAKSETVIRTVRETAILEAANAMEFLKRSLQQAVKYTFYQTSYDVAKKGGYAYFENTNSWCFERGIPYWRNYSRTFQDSESVKRNFTDSAVEIFDCYSEKYTEQYLEDIDISLEVPDYYGETEPKCGNVTYKSISPLEAGIINDKCRDKGLKSSAGGATFFEKNANFSEATSLMTFSLHQEGLDWFVSQDSFMEPKDEAPIPVATKEMDEKYCGVLEEIQDIKYKCDEDKCEAEEAIKECLKTDLLETCLGDYLMGKYCGGWKGTLSGLVNQKLRKLESEINGEIAPFMLNFQAIEVEPNYTVTGCPEFCTEEITEETVYYEDCNCESTECDEHIAIPANPIVQCDVCQLKPGTRIRTTNLADCTGKDRIVPIAWECCEEIDQGDVESCDDCAYICDLPRCYSIECSPITSCGLCGGTCNPTEWRCWDEWQPATHITEWYYNSTCEYDFFSDVKVKIVIEDDKNKRYPIYDTTQIDNCEGTCERYLTLRFNVLTGNWEDDPKVHFKYLRSCQGRQSYC